MSTEKSVSSVFNFKQFQIVQDHCTMKVNTDGILLGAWADFKDAKKILDIGTGTGLIALMAAQRTPEASVVGVEIEPQSYQDALLNAINSPFADRLQITLDSIQNYALIGEQQFDHIISNPPFFTGGTFSANENKANVRHAIKLPHGDLLNSVNKLMTPRAFFSVILPFIEGLRFIELAERSGIKVVRMAELRPRPSKPIERLLITFNKSGGKIEKEEMCIYANEGNRYSQEFIELTKDFYLDLK